MPLLTVSFSGPLDHGDAEQVTLKLSAIVAELLGKPERYVAVTICAPVAIAFAGSNAPACVLELCNIGALETPQTARMSRALCKAMHDLTSIPEDRVYVLFRPVDRHLWGHSGGTFA